MSNDVGELYVVATPIGNLGDITRRAIEVLENADIIFAEDTRHSLGLLNALGIGKSCQALHEHNEAERIDYVRRLLDEGKRLALISDAGTPLISDPGFVLVRALREQGYRITPIPGVSAVITALSVAGLPTDRFSFEGFLPARRSARQQVLKDLLHETRTMVFYESPHRILDSLADLDAVMGDRPMVLARELTKKFETVLTGNAAELLGRLQADPVQRKGEMVLLVHGAAEVETDGQSLVLEQVLSPLLEELPLKQAVKLAVKITGLKKNAVYQRALTLGEASGSDSD